MKEKTLYWVPRILTILAIMFTILFSFDVFGGDEPLLRKLMGFLMHNIPALILTVVLIIAWRWETIGGILFIISAITASIIFKGFSGNFGILIVMAPFFIVGILFILHNHIYNKVTEVK